MSSVTSLKDFKDSKKAKIIHGELLVVIRIFNLAIEALKHYARYGIVQKVISVIQSNKTLLEIHVKKYEKLLEKTSKT